MCKDYVTFECVHIVNTDETDPDERHAVAYADVDGYTADENEEGTVICRIWLLRQTNGPTNEKRYIVDWHHNGYRGNKTVLELIESGKWSLADYMKNIVNEVFAKAYDRYKLKWMLKNGHSMSEFMDRLHTGMAKLPEASRTVYGALDNLETTEGFANVMDIWHCEDTFRMNEWEDEYYMRQLLNGRDYGVWCNRHQYK